jgi:hypothetical protein
MSRRVLLFFLLAFLVSTAALAADTPKLKASAIQVMGVTADEGIVLPAEFRVALYENMINQITKTKRFAQVYRDGSTPADAASTLTLRSTVTGFKEGSARMRQVTTVTGSTKIKVHLEFVDSTGKVVLEKDVNGNVYFMGENLRATYNFSKSVGKIVKDSFEAAPAGSAGGR